MIVRVVARRICSAGLYPVSKGYVKESGVKKFAKKALMLWGGFLFSVWGSCLSHDLAVRALLPELQATLGEDPYLLTGSRTVWDLNAVVGKSDAQNPSLTLQYTNKAGEVRERKHVLVFTTRGFKWDVSGCLGKVWFTHKNVIN